MGSKGFVRVEISGNMILKHVPGSDSSRHDISQSNAYYPDKNAQASKIIKLIILLEYS